MVKNRCLGLSRFVSISVHEWFNSVFVVFYPLITRMDANLEEQEKKLPRTTSPGKGAGLLALGFEPKEIRVN